MPPPARVCVRAHRPGPAPDRLRHHRHRLGERPALPDAEAHQSEPFGLQPRLGQDGPGLGHALLGPRVAGQVVAVALGAGHHEHAVGALLQGCQQVQGADRPGARHRQHLHRGGVGHLLEPCHLHRHAAAVRAGKDRDAGLPLTHVALSTRIPCHEAESQRPRRRLPTSSSSPCRFSVMALPGHSVTQDPQPWQRYGSMKDLRRVPPLPPTVSPTRGTP